LQDVQQPLAADAAEAMTARRYRAALEMDVDVVPAVESLDDLLGGFRVRDRKVAERLVREDHAPAERVVRAIPLDDAHDVTRFGPLREQREIQTRRPSADADDPHVLLLAAGTDCAASPYANSLGVKYLLSSPSPGRARSIRRTA
jgi:hypothetical protein